MQVMVNTDRNIDGDTALVDQVSDVVASGLTHVSDRITRVEVHLSDENSGSKGGGNDKRCMLEARLEGRQPIAVTHRASTPLEAVSGAVENLTSHIASVLGRAPHSSDREVVT